MTSQLLNAMKDWKKSLDDPGDTTPRPQSHREEVEWFLRVARDLERERGTITPGELHEVMGLLPEVFPALVQRENACIKELVARKDAAYTERNQLVAVLSKIYPSGVAKTAIEGWSEDWHNCVYIDTPVGQCSWHFHDSQAGLFAHLGPYTKPWDGHTTEEKYERLASLPAPADII